MQPAATTCRRRTQRRHVAALRQLRLVGTIELLRQGANDRRAGGVRQAREFIEMLAHVMARIRALHGRAHENGALLRRLEIDDGANRRGG